MGVSRADNSLKIWGNLPISNPKPDLSTLSMHIPSLVKIHWCLLKLSSGNEKRMDGRRKDRHMDVQRDTIIPHHYCVAGYKKKKYLSHTPLIWSYVSIYYILSKECSAYGIRVISVYFARNTINNFKKINEVTQWPSMKQTYVTCLSKQLIQVWFDANLIKNYPKKLKQGT